MESNCGKKLLVIGSAGRECATCWKLSKIDKIEKIFVLPGSLYISKFPKIELVKDIDVENHAAIVDFCKKQKIDLVVVGPSNALDSGLSDQILKANIKSFGPIAIGARIESDKSWSKDFMIKFHIPTARYESFDDVEKAKAFIRSAPYDATVVKACGLALGRGVVVANNREEACKAAEDILNGKKFGSAGNKIVVEEKLTGEEVSIFAFTDGKNVKLLLPVQDHKRLKDDDEGPNTGGMGAYCPCKLITDDQLEFVKHDVIEKAITGFQRLGINYCGTLFAGIMLTPDGPRNLEFNCRLGDPETQALLPLLETDLYDVYEACCNKTLDKIELKWKENKYAVCVGMANAGYPEKTAYGQQITGQAELLSENAVIFHGATADDNKGGYVTSGDRVLQYVAINESLEKAAEIATNGVKQIHFEGAQYRTDIAHKAFRKSMK